MIRFPQFLCAFLLLLAGMTFASQAAVVRDARLGIHPDKTRFVMELDREVPYKVFLLSDPYRVVIDLEGATWRPAPETQGIEGSLVKRYRAGLFDRNIMRVVMDLSQPAVISKEFYLKATSDKGPRLVIDLQAASGPEFSTAARQSRTDVPERRYSEQPAPPAPVAAAPPRQRVVVIDAGHGGVDPGAIGARGTYEKHITLKSAQALKKVLERDKRYRVILTRDKDVFLKLRQRVRVARDNKADLFISLHADAHPDKSVRGASVYTLSETASDAEAARLAAQENKADLIGGIDLSTEDPDVSNILLDLAQRETMNYSAKFAGNLVESLRREINLLRNTHRYAGFAVLKAPDVPSVLIELGYLTNRRDEADLTDENYRQRLVEAIAKGIHRYFEWKETLNQL